ncbi:MAG: UDP-N-acetylmuramoyl-L-alanine--D-glutamate ligase [Spirochaetia bacterium]|nr:UDP-N-acetylmuramoyl-L-alanine--D-glutamate ligase [Spirochaetia bacterium]
MIEISGKRILVLGGAGKSGAAAAELYLKLGATVILSDSDAEKKLPFLGSAGLIDVRPTDGPELLAENPDFLVTAPGVPLSLPVFALARAKGIPIFGENDLAAELIRKHWKDPPWICAITGTDGKSTTTALVEKLGEAAGFSSIACGNFGIPLSSLVLSPVSEQESLLALECSSFQLEPAHFLHAHIAFILNLNQDHLDRYASIEEYLSAKLKITNKQTLEDLFMAPGEILTSNGGAARRIALESLQSVKSDGIYFRDKRVCARDEFQLPGLHNISNLECALAAIDDLARRANKEVSVERLAAVIRSFRGLPHRMEIVGNWKGIEFINDSKATTVQAVCSGLTAFKGKRVALLAGGYDKGLSYKPLADFGASILPFGAAAAKIAADTNTARTYMDLREAFAAGLEVCRAGGVVYLGPACASYDQYNSYEERGEHFRKLCATLFAG